MTRNYNLDMNQVAVQRIERQRARYTINTVIARMKMAIYTLDQRRLHAPHRFILISKSILDELEQCADVLPLTDIESMQAYLLCQNMIYSGYPLVSDESFVNPEIFDIASNIIVIDCSLTSLSYSELLFATASTGFNTIDIILYPTEHPIKSGETIRSPHYCCATYSALTGGWASYMDWDTYMHKKENKDFIDYTSSEIDIAPIPFNCVTECSFCGALILPYSGLSPTTLKLLHEEHHGEITCE
jgi:hypothetical protein